MEKKIKCTDNTCTQVFTSKLALKAHLKLKHSGVKERIKCKYADKGCDKTFTVKGNMIEHIFKCKYNPDGIQEMTCEVCGRLLYAQMYLTTQKKSPWVGFLR